VPVWHVLAEMESICYSGNMRGSTPTSQEAREALAEAARHAMRVRRADSQYRPILLGLAAAYLALGVLVGLFPRGGSVFAGAGVIVIFVGVVAATLILFWRMRVYSRWGPVWFAWSCAAFTIWNAAVVGVSIVTGWWGPHQPGLHLTVSATVATIPLLFAAWLLGKRR
jgi:hypothetical protein